MPLTDNDLAYHLRNSRNNALNIYPLHGTSSSLGVISNGRLSTKQRFIKIKPLRIPIPKNLKNNKLFLIVVLKLA